MQNPKQPINLIGGGFRHSLSTSGFEPKYITWVKNGEPSPISIYVDASITNEVNPTKQNYGWLCESKTIQPNVYEWARNNTQILRKRFRTVFTHDLELYKTSDIFTLTECSSKSFLSENDIYPKSKLCSIITSNKNFCKEHLFRLEVVKKYSSKCDLYGRGFNEIQNKLMGLKDYCFSFVIENATYSNMFTEKITDCFVTGTIPIYYGMNNIGDFFNKDGIIILDDNFDFNSLSFELYHSKINSVRENYMNAINILCAEDYIYDKIIKYGI